jgi:hypothetical protein
MHGMVEDEVAPLQTIIELTEDSRKTGSE